MRSAVATRPRPRISAHHTPIAPSGAQVQVTLAVRWISPGKEGACDYVVDYCGSRFLVFHSDIVATIDEDADLVQVRMAATILSHDGRVSYIVSVPGATLRVHEQNIARVVESEAAI